MKPTSPGAQALTKAFEKNMAGKFADHKKVPAGGAEKVHAALTGRNGAR